METQQRIAANIRRLRAKHELTHEALADEMGVALMTVKRWQKDRMPGSDHLDDLALVFEVDVAEFVKGVRDG